MSAQNASPTAHIHQLAQPDDWNRETIATEVLHDVGNVLNSVGVNLQMLRRDGADPRALSALRSFVNNAKRQPDLIQKTVEAGPDRLIAYLGAILTQLEASQAALDMQMGQINGALDDARQMIRSQQGAARHEECATVLDLAEVVDDAVELLRERAYDAGITLRREGLDRVALMADRSRVLRILTNLITNAMDAVAHQPPMRRLVIIDLGTLAEGPRVSVIDHGVGIDAATASRIFDHGFSTKVHGHGFGLSGCAQAAEEMGAVLRFHSEGIGEGSTFTLTLPWRA